MDKFFDYAILLLMPFAILTIAPQIKTFSPIPGKQVLVFWTPIVRLCFIYILLLMTGYSWLGLIFQEDSQKLLLYVYLILLLTIYLFWRSRSAKLHDISYCRGAGKIYVLLTWEESTYIFLSGTIVRIHRQLYICKRLSCSGETLVELFNEGLENKFRVTYEPANEHIQIVKVKTGEIRLEFGPNQIINNVPDKLQAITIDNVKSLSQVQNIVLPNVIDIQWLDANRLFVFDGRAVRVLDFRQHPIEIKVSYAEKATAYYSRNDLMMMPSQELVLNQRVQGRLVNVLSGKELPRTKYPYPINPYLGSSDFVRGFETTYANGMAGLSSLSLSEEIKVSEEAGVLGQATYKGAYSGDDLYLEGKALRKAQFHYTKLMVSYAGKLLETRLPPTAAKYQIAGTRNGNYLLLMLLWPNNPTIFYLLNGRNLDFLREISLAKQMDQPITTYHSGLAINEDASLLFMSHEIVESSQKTLRIQLDVWTLGAEAWQQASLSVNRIPLESQARINGSIHSIQLNHDGTLLAVGTEAGIVIFAIPK